MLLKYWRNKKEKSPSELFIMKIILNKISSKIIVNIEHILEIINVNKKIDLTYILHRYK